MNLAAQIIKRATQKNKLAVQKNNEVAAQNYEISCPNLRQPLKIDVCLYLHICFTILIEIN